MSAKVLDSWALMAFFKDESAAEEVEQFLLRATENKYQLLLCVINWGEIYYSIMRAESQAIADEKAREIAALPIKIIGVGDDLVLTHQAALYKAKYKMSYADCFVAALAKVNKVELLTGDREFKEVEREIKIHWLK